MHTRRRGRQSAVALVLDQGERARRGHAEVHAADADLGAQEILAQRLAHAGRHFLGDRGEGQPEFGVQDPAHLLLRLVDGRDDDVRRVLADQLDDPFAEVRLDHLEPGREQVAVELGLLADHRLALDHAFGLMPTRDVEHDPIAGRGVGCPVHDPARGLHLLGELRQVVIEPAERVRADQAGVVAHRIGLLERGQRLGAQGREATGGAFQCFV